MKKLRFLNIIMMVTFVSSLLCSCVVNEMADESIFVGSWNREVSSDGRTIKQYLTLTNKNTYSYTQEIILSDGGSDTKSQNGRYAFTSGGVSFKASDDFVDSYKYKLESLSGKESLKLLGDGHLSGNYIRETK